MKGIFTNFRDEQLTLAEEHEHTLHISVESPDSAALTVSNANVPRNSNLVRTSFLICILYIFAARSARNRFLHCIDNDLQHGKVPINVLRYLSAPEASEFQQRSEHAGLILFTLRHLIYTVGHVTCGWESRSSSDRIISYKEELDANLIQGTDNYNYV